MSVTKAIFILLFLLISATSFSQNVSNVSDVRIDTGFSPEPLTSQEQEKRTRPANNPFNINITNPIQAGQIQGIGNVHIVKSENPFDYAKKNQNSQPQAKEAQPFDNYQFVKDNINTPPPLESGQIQYIFDQTLVDKTSELYRRANKPNQQTQTSITKEPEFREKKEVCDPKREVCVIYYISDTRIDVEIQNNTKAFRTISLLIWNKNSEVDLKVRDTDRIILHGEERIKIAEISRISETEDFNFNFNFNSIDGFVDAIHNDNYIYSLPLEVGKAYKMVQGYGGKFSHEDAENYFAYDFRMPVGTPIYAAREGTVVRVKENFVRGGIDRSLKQKANYIHIEHDDGTLGSYGHIMNSGALVKVGDYVQKGQKIGYSGNTGYSGSPHLHFAVVKVKKSGKLESVAVKFQTKNGVESRLKENEYYSR